MRFCGHLQCSKRYLGSTWKETKIILFVHNHLPIIFQALLSLRLK
jgi:hypothetical protein